MNNPKLIIDEEFKNLIRPLRQKELLQLEENILEEGCRDPIVVWNNIIIDGHNRYEICTRHNIEFSICEKDFSSREEVLSWICKNQLGRRNITEETRKYLIGRQYECEKKIHTLKNPNGLNQYNNDEDLIIEETISSKNKTAKEIGLENNITHATVSKYANFSKALDTIAEKSPELRNKILSGRYKISHHNIMALSELNEQELKRLNQRMDRGQSPFVQYSTTRSIIEDRPPCEPSIKDTPKYDPDAQVVQLALTVPSWTSSIKRTRENTDYHTISLQATEKLLHNLKELYNESYMLIKALEVKHD